MLKLEEFFKPTRFKIVFTFGMIVLLFFTILDLLMVDNRFDVFDVLGKLVIMTSVPLSIVLTPLFNLISGSVPPIITSSVVLIIGIISAFIYYYLIASLMVFITNKITPKSI